jgi:hypothetical protein
VFRPEVGSTLESARESALDSALCVGYPEMYLFLCVFSTSADSWRCHFGQDRIRACGFDEALPGLLLL